MTSLKIIALENVPKVLQGAQDFGTSEIPGTVMELFVRQEIPEKPGQITNTG